MLYCVKGFGPSETDVEGIEISTGGAIVVFVDIRADDETVELLQDWTLYKVAPKETKERAENGMSCERAWLFGCDAVARGKQRTKNTARGSLRVVHFRPFLRRDKDPEELQKERCNANSEICLAT